MDYIKVTEKDIRNEEALIKIYGARIRELPEGRLKVKTVKGKNYYYKVDPVSGKEKIIPKSDHGLILQLIERHHTEKLLKILRENIKIQRSVLRKYSSYAYEDVIKDAGKSYRAESIGDISPGAPLHSSLMHRTSFGLGVRSKSEALIAEMLKRHGIDFEYEAALELLDEYGVPDVRYPDFTLHIGDETIYWEHIGMLADDGYRAAAERKMHLYFINDIMPGSNLIVTCDDSSGKIDMVGVSRIVESLANDLRMKIITCDGNDKLIE